MDMDVGNYGMLLAGAASQHAAETQDGWQPMSAAPRDGTVIEVRCSYGVAPWYGLYKWSDTRIATDQHGQSHTFKTEPAWIGASDPGSSIDGGSSFKWRPYTGDVAQYADPTGGAQNSAAYWRGAVAAKYGLPPDTFEREVARNVARDRKSWWQRAVDAIFGAP